MLEKLIESLRDGKHGYKFDQPVRIDENSMSVVVPVLRCTKRIRDYLLLSEARDVEITDTGQIDFVRIVNHEDSPIFIARGEIFKGKTQERAAIHGYIIQPRKGNNVAVRCVHYSKGIVSRASMVYGGKVPYGVDLSTQSSTWATASAYCSKSTPSSNFDYADNSSTEGREDSGITYNYFGYHSSDDLVSALDNIKKRVKDIVNKIPYRKNQIGVALVKQNKLLSLELYNHPDSWKAIYDDMLFKEGSSFFKNEETLDIFEYNPKKVNDFILHKLNLLTTKPIYDKEYSVLEVENEFMKGEMVIYKKELLHLQLISK